MIIPLRHVQIKEPATKRLLRPDQGARLIGVARRKQQLLQFSRTAASCTRGMFILVGLLTLRWHMLASISMPIVVVGVMLGCLTLTLGYTQRLSGWPILLADSITIALLLKGTGGPGSPLLALTFLLILQGALLGGSNGALAGSGACITILLMLNIVMRHPSNAIVVDLTFLYLACGFGSSWLWQRGSVLLSVSFAELDKQKHALPEPESARPSGLWQGLNLHIAACTTLEQLARFTTSHAATIVQRYVTVELPSSMRPDQLVARDAAVTCIPIIADDVCGVITIDIPAGELTAAQREALEQLAALVAQRSAALHSSAWQKRQEAALAALWEISGLLRLTHTRYENVRDGLSRLAAALDLHWLALLVPNELQTLAPIMIVRGRATSIAPLISGAHLRIAAEALRSERPLIRSEGNDVLACLPICLTGYAPLVLVARGNAADAASQALLMLFGNLVAERLASDCADRLSEPCLYQAAIA
ncbi:MAG: hypothetical protein ABIV47_03590 [Roseiflexaceae bacterium]